MSIGRYLTLCPRFAGLSTLSEVRIELSVRRHYLKELRQQVKRHQGYRHDGYWQTKTRADRIMEEIRMLEDRACMLRQARGKR